jgi:hypothetical protein
MRKADKVALVGWWPANRYRTPWDDPEYEIWGVNEAATKPWMKRWDRMFQMHGRWNFTRPENPNDPNHFEWLKSLPGPESPDYRPVYMQMGWTDVPASVAFPRKAIEEEYLNPYHKRIRYPGPGEDQIGVVEDSKGYFGSSAAYMLAMAALEGFPEIHMYGFTMSSETEYVYQRENGSFWLGLLMGRKHKIVLPDPCDLLVASGLYGYEVTEMLGRQDLEFRLGDLERIVMQKQMMLNTLSGAEQAMQKVIADHPELEETLKPELVRFSTQKETALNELWSATGAKHEIDNWIKTLDMKPTHPDFGKYVAGTDLEVIKKKEGEDLLKFGREFQGTMEPTHAEATSEQ